MDREYANMPLPNGRSRSAIYNRPTGQPQLQRRANMSNEQTTNFGRSIDRAMPLQPDNYYNKSSSIYHGYDSTSGSSSSAAQVHNSAGKHLDQDKKRYKSVPKVLKLFAEQTSCVGPPYILTSNKWYSTAFWTILFLCAVSMTVYQLIDNFTMYFNYPVKTTVSLGYRALPFPMVTICNTNPIRHSKMDLASEDLKDFLGLINPVQFKRMPPPPPPQQQSSNSPPGGNGRRRKRFLDPHQLKTAKGGNASSFRPGVLDEKFLGGNEHPLNEILSDFKFLYGSEDRDTRQEMGHQIGDMLLSCSFEGRECDESDFTLLTTSEYGNCYTFNQKNATAASNKHILSRRPGSQHGLQVMLYLEVDEYIPGLTLGYGSRVSILHPGTMAFPSVDGIFVSAGMETDIGTKMLQVSRLASPYGDCVAKDWFTKEYGHIYTKHACQETCFYRKILSTCNCILMSSEEYFPKQATSSYNACITEAEYECVSEVQYQLIEERNITCSCNDPCFDTAYDMQLSNREWPVDDYLYTLIDGVCRGQKTDLDIHCNRLMDFDDQTARRNFLKLNIFYRDLNYQMLKEEPDYPRSQFLSDLGGSIGLWVGLSVLSVAELLQLVVELTRAFYMRCRYAGQMQKKTPKKKQDLLNINNINRHGKHQFSTAGPQLMPYEPTPTSNQIWGFHNQTIYADFREPRF